MYVSFSLEDSRVDLRGSNVLVSNADIYRTTSLLVLSIRRIRTTDIDKVDEIGLGTKVPGREPSHGDEHFELHPKHNFGNFQNYANEYSRRDLTRPHDALNAFMGMESSLREVYSHFF
ncbi:hypothetical protein SLS63_009304 [Diaporthe eres]|uniref:Uncharacterized protein n=1 Tax=Diaporthe eres TaxID=83184 RepID=A0ABR1P017_DIAER